ncbi:MAG TPA: hypothetical protein PLN25_04775 [Deltaproteobacteria bacterium]|nr:hypothetical protein [Deltaproteobacteria bacterium]HQB38966.1 hypothetical protein [Deltaproteobacteria bacterium]
MNSERKQRLLELGEERLADALLELANSIDASDDLVERMIATPQENIKRFKAKLAELKRSRRFIGWGESARFARELGALLEDLRAAVEDPRTGAELVAAFYEADVGILAHCDDSSGNVGDLFRYNARELFVSYASRCADKEWLGDLVFRVIQSDDYGVRDAIVDCAKEYLPEPVMRVMVGRLQKKADQESDEYQKRHWLNNVESLARQLKDAPLFEQARLASWGNLSTAACVDIAKVYLESGDGFTALSWLEKIAETDTFLAEERDTLLLEIHDRAGNRDKQYDAAWRIFRRSRRAISLERLLDVIGHDQRDDVLAGEIGTILGESVLSLVDAAFLVDIERLVEAETYLLKRADQLNDDYYGGLLRLAEAMEKGGRQLCASLIYRALLDSILRRAQTKTYPHGVRYLKKLDRLAGSVSDWQTFDNHSVYMQGLQQNHGRKSSFWSRYGS